MENCFLVYFLNFVLQFLVFKIINRNTVLCQLIKSLLHLFVKIKKQNYCVATKRRYVLIL